MFDGEAFGKEMVGIVESAIAKATAPLIQRLASLEQREAPASGRDGRDGLPGRDGANGIDGKDGQDGQHGLSAEDVEAKVLPDGRTVEFSLKQGEHLYTFELAFPVPMYRGVYIEGEAYEKGDMVTWGGSMWHCNAQTDEKPGSDAWQLAVKKGRDGKDAR